MRIPLPGCISISNNALTGCAGSQGQEAHFRRERLEHHRRARYRWLRRESPLQRGTAEDAGQTQLAWLLQPVRASGPAQFCQFQAAWQRLASL